MDHRPQQSTWYGTFGFHQAKFGAKLINVDVDDIGDDGDDD